jgi:hypothetical protein
MRYLIGFMFALAATLTPLSLAAPAVAQTSGTGVKPVFVAGEGSLVAIQDECGVTTSRGQVDIKEPLSGTKTSGAFIIELQVANDQVSFTDKSPNDQFRGTPGVEVVAVRGSKGTYVYCYPTRITDTGLVAPESASPTGVTIVWGPGPCSLDAPAVKVACDAYNESNLKADIIQTHLIGPGQPSSICACPPSQSQACDPVLPLSAPDSCNPNKWPLTAIESTVVGTIGTGTCQSVTYPCTIAGMPRTCTTTVCK